MTTPRKPREKTLAEQQHEDDTRWLMGDPRGRRLVWRWLADGGLFRASFIAGDSHATAFREGERNAALRLHAQVMQHAPEQFVRMLAEAQAEADSRAHTAAARAQSPAA